MGTTVERKILALDKFFVRHQVEPQTIALDKFFVHNGAKVSTQKILFSS